MFSREKAFTSAPTSLLFRIDFPTAMARPGGIIILHENRPWSVDQLDLVLKGLTATGWKVESVGGLLKSAKKLQTKAA